ncbi:Coiled-coil domain-containing protein 39, partial [Xylographa carneopallida]|nr:Coiled-coil domain-containing protein 39 [Xylographa carneopallida]
LFSNVSAIEATGERLSVMQQHLRHVQTEYAHSVQLLRNKSRDTAVESHMTALLDRDEGRMSQEGAQLERRQTESQHSLSALHANKARLEDSLAAYQQQMAFSNEQLLALSLAAKQKEEDRLLLAEYGRVDDVRLRELRVQLDEASSGLANRRRQLAAVETASAEHVMAAEQLQREYRQQHERSMRVMADWDESVRRMHGCDERLMRLGEEVVAARREVKAWEERSAEVEQFGAGEERNNKRMRARIEESERANGKVRDEWQRSKASIVEMEEEVVTKRNVMDKLEAEVRLAREKQQRLKALKEDRAAAVAEQKQRVADTSAEYKEELLTLQAVNNQHEHLQAALSSSQQQLHTAQQQLVSAKDELYALGVRLAGERAAEEQLLLDIANAQGTSKALQAKIHSMDVAAIKQQEMLYAIEFVIQGLERKVNDASGKRSVEESAILRKLMDETAQRMEAEEADNALMDVQVKRLRDELRAVKRRQEVALAALQKQQAEVAAVRVDIAARQREADAASGRVDELRVAHDRHKLDVLKLRQALQAEQDAVWRRQTDAIDIRQTIATRRQEVSAYEARQRVEQREEEAERARLSKEAAEDEKRLDMLQRKYTTLHAKCVGSEQGRAEEEDEARGAEGGERRTQGYYIVKAGLEREEEVKRQSELTACRSKLESDIEGVTKLCMQLEGHTPQHRKRAQQQAQQGTGAAAEEELLARLRSEQRQLERELLGLSEQATRQSRDRAVRERVLASLVNAIGQLVDATRTREAKADKERSRYAELRDGVERAQRECGDRAAEWRLRSGQQQRQRKEAEEEKTAVSDRATTAAEADMDEVGLYCDVQDSWRRYTVAARLLREWLKPQQLAGDNEQFAALIDAEVRPSSAASSIASQLSNSSHAEGQLSSRSNMSTRSAGTRKSLSRASSAGTADLLVIDARKA